MIENIINERRKIDVQDNYPGTPRRYFDETEQLYVVKIISGEWYVSTRKDEMITTTLGSCVAVCIRDRSLKIGGMNHFILPGDESMDGNITGSARYGIFATEQLINGIIKHGGKRDALEIKVFGGGNVMNSSTQIGSRNIDFIHDFIHKEGLKIDSEDLGGKFPRLVQYYPESGRVMIRKLRRKEDLLIVEAELKSLKLC